MTTTTQRDLVINEIERRLNEVGTCTHERTYRGGDLGFVPRGRLAISRRTYWNYQSSRFYFMDAGCRWFPNARDRDNELAKQPRDKIFDTPEELVDHVVEWLTTEEAT